MLKLKACINRDLYKDLTVVTVVLFVLISTGCASTKVPAMSSDFDTSKMERDETVLWEQADKLEAEQNRMLAEYDFFELNKYLNQMLQKVNVQRLEQQTLRPRIRLTPDVEPNIFMMPNGAAYISVGMLALVENEAQLAFLLAHELAHYKLRHGLKQARNYKNQRKRGDVFGVWLGFLLGGHHIYDPHVADGSSELWEILATVNYEVDLEYAADRYALASVKETGYDLSSAKELLHKSRELEYDYALDTLEHPGDDPADHPAVRLLDERLEIVENYLDQASPLAMGYVGELPYLQNTLSAVKFSVLENIQLGYVARADTIISDYLAVMPANATTYYLVGMLAEVATPENPYQSLAYFQKSIELDSAFSDSLLELGYAYRALGNNELSKEYFNKYLEQMPYTAEAQKVRRILAEV